MSKIAPYHIQHVQINKRGYLDLFPVKGQRYYYVFWWLNIALGHLYVEKEGIEEIQSAFLDAIIPALKKYDTGEKHINDIRTSYLSSNYSLFEMTIEKILNRFLIKNNPKKVDISVVICTRNRSESLRNCLEKINMQACMPSEIIVVDNAPTDDSTMSVVKQFKNVTYHIEKRPGLSFARNLGCRLAKWPIIAFTDDDVEVDKLWTYRIWETFLQENIDGMTGLVLATSLETESQQIFEKHWGFNKGYEDIYYNLGFVKYSGDIPRLWELGAGANMAFRKEVIQKVNYFDERLGSGAAGCSEDSELWFRMIYKGCNIHYNPRVVVFHEHRKEISQLKKQLYNYMQGHVASILIQNKNNKQIGYKKYLYKLFKYYILLLGSGFPSFSFRHKTLFNEIQGIFAGVVFYQKNKDKPALSKNYHNGKAN